MSWDAAFKAYLSPELRIDCGSYHGVLKVDGAALHVEDFVVKSYTFEVDLFIKEDILEGKCPSPPAVEFRSSPLNTACAAPIPTTTVSQPASGGQDDTEDRKVVDIVKPQLTHKEDIDLTPTRESAASCSDLLQRSSPLTNPISGDSMVSSILKTSTPLKSSSPLQTLPVRRASPIGDDKSGDLAKLDSEYFERSREDKKYAGQMNGSGRGETIANETAALASSTSKFVEDIMRSTQSRQEEDGLPVRTFSKETYRLEGTGYESQDREDKYTSAASHDEDRTSSANRPTTEESSRLQQVSRESQHHTHRPADGIYGRPPSQPSHDRLDERSTKSTSRGGVSNKRHDDYDRRSLGSERDKDVDTDYNIRNRERFSLNRERDDEYGHTGSRPPSVPSGSSFREGSQGKDGRHEVHADAEGRNRSYMSRGSREGSVAGSQHSSRASSHTSLTSEQELGQYWENDLSRSNGEHYRERRQHETVPDHGGSGGARLERPASVPNYGARLETRHDKRSSTPDNRVRIPAPSRTRPDSAGGGGDSGACPALRGSLTTDRLGEALGGRASVASSDGRRTVTPGLGARQLVSGEEEELRNAVENLRQLVSRRDSEIRSLRDELQDVKDNRHSSYSDARPSRSSVDRVHNSLEYKQLQSEKEILATEVVSLKEEVQRLTSRTSSGRGGDGGGGRPSSSINDYSPYSPVVLQRKIADLESQIHDLQEVNEATTSSLSRTEEKVRLLQEENHDLRAKSGNNLEDSGDQHSLRVQLRTLREDIASLRERNFQLTEENMRLQERQGSRTSTAAAGLTMQRSGSSLGLKTDNGQTNHSAYTGDSTSTYGASSRYPSGNSKISPEPGRQPLVYSSRVSREELAPKDYRTRGSSLGRAYNHSDQPTATTNTSGSTSLHQRNAQDSSHLRYSSSSGDVLSHRPPNSAFMSSRSYVSSSTTVADRDRYRPDGEVSEQVHTDKYRPGVGSSYDNGKQGRSRKSPTKESTSHKSGSYNSFSKDRSGGLGKDGYGDYRREDTYLAYLSDSKLDRQPSQPKQSPPRNSLGSKDIFMNLKKKLASQWLQQENRYISGNLEFDRYQSTSGPERVEEDGDDSDTATDILLAQDTGTSRVSFKSDKSPGSDGALSSDEAAEDVDSQGHLDRTSSLRRRCRSADPSGSARHSSDPWRTSSSRNSRSLQAPATSVTQGSQRSGGAGGSPSSYRGASPGGDDRDSMRSAQTAGLRSVLPTPLITQHNKHELAKNHGASLLNSTLTQGLRPFAPRSPADIRVEDVVKFSRLGGKLTQGCVKYVGHLPFYSPVNTTKVFSWLLTKLSWLGHLETVVDLHKTNLQILTTLPMLPFKPQFNNIILRII
ncbi:hypothetical protein EGW08_005888 [Elysia chlorotica]|uniref:Uncharacterized protein n=1 Tax=Elysia chlorotica TaxID=188477 RepID=A0A433TXR9_ELYCH|nr:hypothetical protein EGW08_005888 [Elysia chlorotica]